MSLLAIQIPPRVRPPARAAGDAVPATEFDYVLSANGRAVTGTGRATPSRMPKADSVVAVLSDADVAWHLVTMPKSPASRVRAALAGILEDALLDDDEVLHLALPPRYGAGQAVWVAVVNKPWLSATLAMLEGSGLVVERVIPPWAPDGRARGHFSLDGSADGALRLALLRAEGAVTLRTAEVGSHREAVAEAERTGTHVVERAPQVDAGAETHDAIRVDGRDVGRQEHAPRHVDTDPGVLLFFPQIRGREPEHRLAEVQGPRRGRALVRRGQALIRVERHRSGE